MAHYQFVQNRLCEYFPCHKDIGEADFNCLFCYCPLYPLAENCGGNFSYTAQGIKDCSACLRPHVQGNYDDIISRMEQVMELAKKRESGQENP